MQKPWVKSGESALIMIMRRQILPLLRQKLPWVSVLRNPNMKLQNFLVPPLQRG